MTSSRGKWLTWISVFSSVGAIISFAISKHFYELRSGIAGFESFCSVSGAFDCDAVQASRHAELFLGIPLSSFGAGWFVSILLLSLMARSESSITARRGILIFSGLGFAISLAYLGIMLWAIQAKCLYCLGMDAMMFLCLVFSSKVQPRSEELSSASPTDFKKLLKVWIGSTVAAVFLGAVLFQQKAPSASETEMYAQSALARPAEEIRFNGDEPSMGGDSSAPITIVKFSDFQCPACQMGARATHSVLSKYKGQVRFIYRHFPLDAKCNPQVNSSLHPEACNAAKISVCAAKQGMFQKIYEKFFEHQEEFKNRKALDLAVEAGMDRTQLEACLADPEVATAVARDIEEGIRLKIQATPTFFVNGHRVEGGLPPSAWNEIIDRLLASKK